MHEWRELLPERGTRTDAPMKPQVVAHELNKLLADDASRDRLRHDHDLGRPPHRHPRRADVLVSGNLASMACGLPYALAAAIAYPGRQVVAFVGDGGSPCCSPSWRRP